MRSFSSFLVNGRPRLIPVMEEDVAEVPDDDEEEEEFPAVLFAFDVLDSRAEGEEVGPGEEEGPAEEADLGASREDVLAPATEEEDFEEVLAVIVDREEVSSLGGTSVTNVFFLVPATVSAAPAAATDDDAEAADDDDDVKEEGLAEDFCRLLGDLFFGGAVAVFVVY